MNWTETTTKALVSFQNSFRCNISGNLQRSLDPVSSAVLIFNHNTFWPHSIALLAPRLLQYTHSLGRVEPQNYLNWNARCQEHFSKLLQLVMLWPWSSFILAVEGVKYGTEGVFVHLWDSNWFIFVSFTNIILLACWSIVNNTEITENALRMSWTFEACLVGAAGRKTSLIRTLHVTAG